MYSIRSELPGQRMSGEVNTEVETMVNLQGDNTHLLGQRTRMFGEANMETKTQFTLQGEASDGRGMDPITDIR